MMAPSDTAAPSAAAITVRRFVERVRWRSRAEDVAAGAAALVFGACGVAVARFLAAAGSGVPGLFLAVGGLAVGLAGARLLAGAVLRPPSHSRTAAWIEGSVPELRDALATTVEGGPLAGVSAEYAAPRIAGVRAGAMLPARARRRRAGLTVAGIALAVASSVTAVLVEPGTRAAPGPEDRTASEPDVSDRSRGGVAEGSGAVARRDAAAADPAAPRVGSLPRRPGGMTLRAVGAQRDPMPEADPVDAADILVSSPHGFERAVELFVARAKADVRQDDNAGGDDGSAP